VVKKPRCYTPTVIAVGESAVVPPPPAPLVIKLVAQKQSTEKAVSDLGNYICPFLLFLFLFSSFM